MEEIGDFLPFVSISLTLIKLKQNEEIEDFWHSSIGRVMESLMKNGSQRELVTLLVL